MTGFIRPKRCETCAYSVLEGNQRHCRRDPPTAIPIMAQGPHGPALQIQAVFPPVSNETWCGEYAAFASVGQAPTN